MSRRRSTYSRVRDVLLMDNTGVSKESIHYIEREIVRTLSSYMDIDDVSVIFKRDDGLGYKIHIDGRANNIKLPHIS